MGKANGKKTVVDSQVERGEGGVMEEEFVIEEAFDEGGVVIEGEGGIEGEEVREDK